MMRTVRLVALLVIALTLAACSSTSEATGPGDMADTSAVTFASTDAMRAKVTGLVGSSCGEAAEDVTQGLAMTCEWEGKQVVLATYPSEKQAQTGAEYLTGVGAWTVEQQGKWLVAVTGDQSDVDTLVSRLTS